MEGHQQPVVNIVEYDGRVVGESYIITEKHFFQYCISVGAMGKVNYILWRGIGIY
jgi:hypothetical protein